MQSTPEQPFGLTLALPVSLPTGDAGGFVGEGAVSVAPSIATEWVGARVRLGANLGARLRGDDQRLGTSTSPTS